MKERGAAVRSAARGEREGNTDKKGNQTISASIFEREGANTRDDTAEQQSLFKVCNDWTTPLTTVLSSVVCSCEEADLHAGTCWLIADTT